MASFKDFNSGEGDFTLWACGCCKRRDEIIGSSNSLSNVLMAHIHPLLTSDLKRPADFSVDRVVRIILCCQKVMW